MHWLRPAQIPKSHRVPVAMPHPALVQLGQNDRDTKMLRGFQWLRKTSSLKAPYRAMLVRILETTISSAPMTNDSTL